MPRIKVTIGYLLIEMICFKIVRPNLMQPLITGNQLVQVCKQQLNMDQ